MVILLKMENKKTTKKKLRLFNGRSHGSKYWRHHVYVAAYSMAEAARLVSKACYDGPEDYISVSEIKVYYGKDAWGNKMNGIIPDEPCVYMYDETNPNNKPFRVI